MESKGLSMAGRFSRGLSVIDGSLGVFRANPRLVVLPLCSFLLVGSGFAVAAGVAFHYGVVESMLSSDLARYTAIFVGIAVSSSLGTFFNAAIVHCAAKHFDGEATSIRDGLTAAWNARRAIAVWSITAAKIGRAHV